VRAPVRRAAWGSSDKNNHTPRRESRAIACENSGVPTRTWPGVAHARPRGAKESDREQTRIGTRTVIGCVRHLLLDAAYCARIFSTCDSPRQGEAAASGPARITAGDFNLAESVRLSRDYWPRYLSVNIAYSLPAQHLLDQWPPSANFARDELLQFDRCHGLGLDGVFLDLPPHRRTVRRGNDLAVEP
jgi:hypothetical protein